ncbi:hypothetical protein FCK90_08585 [Kocuria coralli]|uniref:Uncharacterized protein n=1 Tax=Kocuria coralli TaxID=1461025 RepID=A0A5J5KWV2_9MICC|nr:hypothetical protein [Kocuria coralli]KAA9394163.1 hypothetical protein FCK90_08585 [Kocuria coralli]
MWTTNSGEAVPGLAGLSGTILVASLILLVLGVVVGVIGVYAGKKAHQSELVGGALMVTVRVGFGAAVIGSVGSLVAGGSTLYAVDKVEVEAVEAESGRGECSQPREAIFVDAGNGFTDDVASEWAALVSSEYEHDVRDFNEVTVDYWPDPTSGCDDGTVDSCRMVHVNGRQNNILNLRQVDETVSPAGECSTGEPEEVAFS